MNLAYGYGLNKLTQLNPSTLFTSATFCSNTRSAREGGRRGKEANTQRVMVTFALGRTLKSYGANHEAVGGLHDVRFRSAGAIDSRHRL